MHNNIPKKRVFTEISLRMNDNTVCKTKLENYRPVMNSPLQLKVFEYMLLPLLTNNLKSCNQQFGYRNQSCCTYAVTIMKQIIMQYNKWNSNNT